MNGLRDLGDQLKEKLGEGVVVLASASRWKSKPCWQWQQMRHVKKGAHAGNLIKGIARHLLEVAAVDVRIWHRLEERIQTELTLQLQK